MSRLLGEPPITGTMSENRNVLPSQKPNFRGTVAAIILAFVASVLPSPLSDSPALASQAGAGEKVAVGQAHSLAVNSEGQVFAWGDNLYGQLGDGKTAEERTTPVAVTRSGVLAGQRITSVAAGERYSVALSSTGEIYTWGVNAQGQLGDGTRTERSVPVQLTRSEAIAGVSFSAISAGQEHTLALSDDGRVFGWGDNASGQLADGTTTRRTTAVAVTTSGALDGVTIVAIAAGHYHSLALSSDGRVFSWGGNAEGQLGDGTTTQRTTPVAVTISGVLSGVSISAIAAGRNSSYALGSNGRVYSWGFNTNHELGDGTTVSRLEPVAVNTSGVLSGVSISAISAGYYGGYVLDTEGRAYSWGSYFTSRGLLGDGGVADGTVPVAVTTSGVLAGISISALATGPAAQHRLAIGSDNKLYSWGRGLDGRIGDGFTVDRNEPVAVTTSGALSGLSFSSLEAALTPTLATPIKTSDGFSVQLSNYDANFTWNVSASVGSAAIGGSGLISVTGLSAGASSTVTVQTTRTGYTAGSATVASSALEAALAPTFATPTKTSDGFTVQVSNYDDNYSWTASASSGSAAISGSGLITVTGLSAGASSTVTVQTTRTGYTAGSATVASSALNPAPSGDSSGEQGSQAAAYSGPTFDAAKTVAAGSEVTFTGRRLQLVSSAYAGQLQLQIVQAVSSSLTVFIPTSLSANVYDLTVHSSNGKLTFQQGLTVLEAQDQIVGSEAGPKLTVGSFKGFIAIYTKGYEGQKLSAKVAGKWLVVDPLKESWRQNNYSRTVRFTGAGYDIFVHLYIDGEFIKTEMLTTK